MDHTSLLLNLGKFSFQAAQTTEDRRGLGVDGNQIGCFFKGAKILFSFLKAAFTEGVNTNSDRGLRHVVEEAGLSWREAKTRIDNEDWQAELEANRQAMYAFGSWGVPTFRLLDARGNTIVWAGGQDRLWLIAREIQRVLIQA